MRKMILPAAVSLLFPVWLAPPALAAEYYVGEAMAKNGLKLTPHYLLGIEMAPMPKGMGMKGMAMGKDPVHLELDVQAAKGEAHGFADGAWMPYVKIAYTLEKVGDAKFRKTGALLPMTANDGPHYANNVDFAGPGQYKVTFRLSPPSESGFYRHVDKESGVPAWWEPFSAEWTFQYPSKPAS